MGGNFFTHSDHCRGHRSHRFCSKSQHAMRSFSKLLWRGTEDFSAHPSSVRTSVCVWDLIPLPLIYRRRWKRIDFTESHVCLDRQADAQISAELTSTTTTSTFTFAGKFNSGWKRFTMATSRWMVAKRSLLWMTDRQAADNIIKKWWKSTKGDYWRTLHLLQRQRNGKIDEAYKNRMATWRQWVNRKTRGFCCGVTGRNLVLVFSRCIITPTFDLFRLCRTKNLSLLEPLNKDLLLMNHRGQSISGLWELPNFRCLGLVGHLTHVWNSIWACWRPPGPVACPAPPGPVPACGSEQRCSRRSPPKGCERQPAWLHKPGSYHLYNWTLKGCFCVDSIIVNIKDDLDGWILFQRDSCAGRNLHDDDLSVRAYVLTQCAWILRMLSKSHHGCTKWRLSIRTWHVPEHREPGDSRLDWSTLLNSHSRWWSTSPS